MRFLFLALLALAIGTSLALLAQHDPGYVLLSYHGWSAESSLVLFLLLLLLLFSLFYLLLRLLWGAWRLPHTLACWLGRLRLSRAHHQTHHGLIALAEGNWRKAEQQLSRAATRSDTPLINYLGAARAAQKLGATQRRDLYLLQAHQSMPKERLAIGLTQTELQLSQGQLEQALASLRELHQHAPHHAYVLYLLKKLYEKLQSWDDLYRLLPELRRQQVLAEAEYQAFEQQLCLRLLDSARDVDELRRRWKSFAKRQQQQAELLHHYTEALLRLGTTEELEPLLSHYLDRDYAPALAHRYALLESRTEPAARLQRLEHWLKAHPRDPVLLLAVGRLALHNQLWGKARSYLEASLALEECAETRHELAELLIRLGEKERALELYRQQRADGCERRALTAV